MGILIAIVLLLADAPQASRWGGDHIELQITAAGARLEFDCAHGTIDERVPARDGEFRLHGTFTPEAHGPVRDDGPAAAKAIYSGSIRKDAMTLHVAIEGEDGPGRDFTLTRDRAGNLRKCR